MRRWAEFVLRHRKAVVAFWGIVLVAGIALAGKTTNRLTVDFSLPGPARHRDRAQDQAGVRQRRRHQPLPRHGHAAGGPDGHRARGRRRAQLRFGRDSGAERAGHRRGEHRRQGVPHQGRPHRLRAGVLPVQPVADARSCSTDPIRAAADSGHAGRSDGRRHRRGRAGDRRRQRQRPGRARRDPARRRRRARRARVRVRFVPGVPAAARRRGLHPGHVRDAAADHLPDRRVVHRPVPGRARRPGRGHRLLAAARHPVARGTRPRSRQPRRGRRRHGDRGQRRAVQRCDRRDRPARADRAAGSVHAQHGLRRGADPAGQRDDDTQPHPGHPRRHRAAGRLAEDPPREPGQPRLEPLGRADRRGAAGSPRSRRSPRWPRCIGVFFGIKIGLASSESLAKTGRPTTRCRPSSTAASRPAR